MQMFGQKCKHMQITPFGRRAMLAPGASHTAIIGPIGRMRRGARPNALRPGKLRGSTDKLDEEMPKLDGKIAVYHRWKLCLVASLLVVTLSKPGKPNVVPPTA